MAESPVLTNAEAARFLRLDEDHEEVADQVRALHRLVREGRLRPLRGIKPYKFAIDELMRFVNDATEEFAPRPAAENPGIPQATLRK